MGHASLTSSAVPFGVHSMTSRLEHALVQSPHAAFGSAFDHPEHCFHHPVDLERARREHRGFVELLSALGVVVHDLRATEAASPDLVYAYDPALITDRGAILLRSGKATRRGEEELAADWFSAHDIPIVGRIEAPGTVDGGDVFWLLPDLVCIGRSLRTNRVGIEQLEALLEERSEVFDLPYDRGHAECLHLMSVVSLVADDVAVVELGRLPAGLYSLMEDEGIEMVPIADEEASGLASNVLAVAPGVAVMLEGNPVTARRLLGAGVEVHTFTGREICLNGSGGPTCLTRPVARAS